MVSDGFPRPEILLHPNIPKPLHGVNPRSIMGKEWWDVERKRAYAEHGHRCWACGAHKKDGNGGVYWLEAHECYDIDYSRGEVRLREIVALCKLCHDYIHSGRLQKLVESGEVSERYFFSVMDHGDRVLLEADLSEVDPITPDYVAEWSEWHLVMNDQKYYSKFESFEGWEEHYNTKRKGGSMAEEIRYMNMDPDDAVSGGGLLNGVKVVWKDAKYTTYGFPNKEGKETVVPPVPCLCVSLDDAATGEEYGPQYWSVGRAEEIAPTEDGNGMKVIKAGDVHLWDKSRAYHLFTSMRNCGFPKEKFPEIPRNAAMLNGMVATMVQEPSLIKKKEPKKSVDGSRTYEDTTLVVGEIEKMPWEAGGKVAQSGKASGGGGKAGGGKAAGGGGAKGKETAVAQEGGADMNAVGIGAILAIAAEKGGQVLKREVATEVFKKLQDRPDVVAILGVVNDDTWLGDGDKPWKYEDGVVKVG